MSDQDDKPFTALVARARDVRADLERRRAEIERDFPGWVESADARMTVFAKLSNTLRAAELALCFLDQELGDAEWWLKHRRPSLENGEFKFEHMAFSQMAKGAMLQSAFTAMDSGFRLVLRAFDPAACSRGTAQFKSIADCLLFTHLGMTATESEVVEFFRTLRNLVHNDGVFFHSKHDVLELSYQGRTWQFEYGKPIEFATWAFVLDLVADLIGFLETVIRRPKTAGWPSHIPDPWVENPAPVA